MKAKSHLKFIFDLVMALIFVLLYNTRVLGGLPFHEIAGVFIGAIIFMHLIFNFSWIKQITAKLLNPQLAAKTRLGYILNILLLVSMILVIFSGLMISRVLVPGWGGTNQRWFHTLHVGLSYFTLAIVGVHVGLHGQWIAGIVKKVFKTQTSRLPVVIAKAALVLIVIFGGMQLLQTQVAPQIAKIGTVSEVAPGAIPPPDQSNARFQGNIFEGEDHGGRIRGERGGQFEGSRTRTMFPAGVILIYSGIMGGFALATVFAENALKRNKPLAPEIGK